MSDDGDEFDIYYDFTHNYQECEDLLNDDTAKANMIHVKGSYKGTYAIPFNADGVSVCLVDADGNTTFRNNISLRVN